MWKKSNEKIILNIVCYVAICIEMVVTSYIATTQYTEYPMKYAVLLVAFILPVGVASIFLKLSEYYVILKVLKEKAYFKNLHNQVIPVLAGKAIVGVVIQVVLMEYKEISEIVVNIVNLLYYIILICMIRKYYKLNFKKTTLFIIILTFVGIMINFILKLLTV